MFKFNSEDVSVTKSRCFLIYGACWLWVGCKPSNLGPEAPPLAGPASDAVVLNAEQNNGSVESFILSLRGSDRGRIDPEDLQVGALSVAKVSRKVGRRKVVIGRLSYATGLKVDFVEIQAGERGSDCFAEDLKDSDCPYAEEESLRATDLIEFEQAGRIEVRVRACVEEDRSSDDEQNCGSYSTTFFEQPVTEGVKERARLARERQGYFDELDGLGEEVEAALQDFNDEADQCDANELGGKRVEGMRILVGNVLQLGEKLVSQSIYGTPTQTSLVKSEADLVDPSVGIVKQLPNETLARNLAEAKRRLSLDDRQPSEATFSLQQQDTTLASLQSAISTFQSVQNITPVDAVQQLGNSVFDLFTAGAQARGNMKCFAEAKLNDRLEQLEVRINDVKKAIRDVDQRLADLEDES